MSESRPYHDEDRLRELYWGEGMEQKEIAAKFDCHKDTIQSWMSKHDIETRIAGKERPHLEDSKHRDEEWLHGKYYDEELNTVEMGELAGVQASTISYWMDNYDMERREQSEATTLAIGTIHPCIYLVKSGNSLYRKAQSANPHPEPPDKVAIHRLCAVAWFGLDSVKGKQIHHKNGFGLDNREENLEPLTPSEHAKIHHEQGDIHN